MENFSDFLGEKCRFFLKKLGHLSKKQEFVFSVVNASSGIFKDSENYQIMNGVLAKKETINQKIDRLVAEGFSLLNIHSILSPGKEEEADYFLLGKMHFRISDRMRGDIEYYRKIFCSKSNEVKNVIAKEYLICSYIIDYKGNQHSLLEMTDWNGEFLIALSILDFERNPEVFIRDRIPKLKKIKH